MAAAVSWAQQPKHHPDLDELSKWIEDQTVASYNITTGQYTGCGFVPEGRARLHFTKDHHANLIRILRAIFNEPHHQNLPFSVREVAQNCSKVFCILFLIGKASYIRVFVRHASLFDDRLPFYKTHPPPGFPLEPGLFDEFFAAQWRFCALNMRPHGDLRIMDETVLPFMEMEQLAAGHTGTVYRIRVHRDHDCLRPTDANDDHRASLHGRDSPVDHKCYAIKTLKRAGSQGSYDREIGAFRRLTDGGMRCTPGMIQFFCGFKYYNTFNVVLEFADRGNLADYLRDHKAPEGAEHINTFWRALLQPVAAISMLHQQRLVQRNSGPDMIVSGWHQDIKPENILVISNSNHGAYPSSFKLADFGLAHFKLTTDGSQANNKAFDAFGTRTYGAPECLSWREFAPFQENLITNAVDIWSLGCVFSEVAVWIARGWSGLSSYRQGRATATSELVDFSGGDCFHDGTQRLRTVDAAHNDVREVLLAPVDFTTSRVLDCMVEDMLQSTPTERPTAMELHQKAEQLLQSATDAIEGHLKSGCQTGPQETAPHLAL